VIERGAIGKRAPETTALLAVYAVCVTPLTDELALQFGRQGLKTKGLEQLLIWFRETRHVGTRRYNDLERSLGTAPGFVDSRGLVLLGGL